MAFRTASIDDYKDLDASRLMRSSFKNFSYPLGCSVSELDSALSDGDFVLEDAEGNPLALVHLKAVFGGICYFDLHILADKGVEPALDGFLCELGNGYGIGKYYVLVLPYEQRELDCLQKISFSQEVVLKEHVFIEGRYHDVVMMGSLDYRV